MAAQLTDDGSASLNPFRRISAGAFHNLVLSNASNEQREEPNGNSSSAQKDEVPLPLSSRETEVFAFGSNRNNILQDPTEDSDVSSSSSSEEEDEKLILDRPKRIRHFSKKYVYEVGTGGSHSVLLEKAVGKDGAAVWICGLGLNGRLGITRPKTRAEAEQILFDSGYSADDTKRLLDDDDDKTFYNPNFTKWCSPAPLRVPMPPKEEIVRVACGMDHTLVLTERGTVYSWGLGSFGNLGNGQILDCWKPTEVTFFSSKPCRAIAAGTKHSIAVTRLGIMYSWGHGGNGRLGQGEQRDASLSPGEIEVRPEASMLYVAAGEAHTAAIDRVGNLYCWGAGSYGRLGHGEEMDVPVPTRVQAVSGIRLTQVELGTLHSLALTEKGEIYSWGWGEATGLMEAGGNQAKFAPKPLTKYGKSDDASVPMRGMVFVQVAAGCFHSLALSRDGQLFSWGLGSEGRLGLGVLKADFSAQADQRLPYQIRVGNKGDKSMVMRGWVDFDSLNAMHAATKNEIVEDEEDKKFSLVFKKCGGMHSAVVVGTADRALWMWGSNEFGQVGSGDKRDRDRPAQVDIKLIKVPIRVGCIALGLEHTLISSLANGKVLFAWGRNSQGQLGLGTTEDVLEPRCVEVLTNVIQVAAGEDHSAALVETGEMYTWGNADCGKLGYGSGMTHGMQNYPRMVRTEWQAQVVSLGAQHTAAVSLSGDLYTWGAGWYGRLGHGDMDNQYAPKRVEALSEGERSVHVQCAAYHTCVLVGDARRLWVCGRDRAVCADDHVDTLRPMTKDFSVAVLAVGAQHTLVLNQLGEVWAWGDNGKGQLGYYDHSSRITQPTRVDNMWPDIKDKIVDITTGYGHTMIVSERDKVQTVYAFGNRTGGRLGLIKVKDGGDKESSSRICRMPNQVDMCWAEGREKRAKRSSHTDEQGNAAPTEQKENKAIFGLLQKKLRDEERDNMEAQLMSLEKKLDSQYHEIIEDIWGLWSPIDEENASEIGTNNEYTLRQLHSRLDRSLCKNLKTMGLADAFPQIDGSLTHPDISSKLVHWEELLWVLQQHPCYLGKLAQHLSLEEDTVYHALPKGQKAVLPKTLFLDVAGCIFKRLRDKRTKHLLLALIRVLVKHEVKNMLHDTHREKHQLFDPKFSKVAGIMSMLTEHVVFHELHEDLYDLDDPDSLLTLVLDWTLPNSTVHADHSAKAKAKAKAKSSSGRDSGDDKEDGTTLFVFTDEEMRKFAEMCNLIDPEKDSKDQINSTISEKLHQHQSAFQRFLGLKDPNTTERPPPRKSEAAQGEEKKPGNANFGEFLEKLKLNLDLACVFANIKEELDRSYETEESIMRSVEREGMRGKDNEDEETKREEKRQMQQRVGPIMHLFMTSILGNLLEKYEKVVGRTFAKKLSDKINDRLESRARAGRDEIQENIAKDEEIVQKKFAFNVKQLGKFFRMAAMRQFTKTQPKLRKFAEEIMDVTLLPYIGRVSKDADDVNEQNMVLDLYKSHFEMQEITLVMETKTLLLLSNALWLYAEDVIDLDSDELGRDKLFQVLLETLNPLPDGVKESQDERERKAQRVWPDFMLMIAERTSVQHNFTVQHRFLEHYKDLCFCRDCHSPIVRSMAPAEQRTRTDLRLIRTYRKDRGVLLGGEYPMENLSIVLSMKELMQIKSRDWISLKSELEEFQKNIKDKINKATNKAAAQNLYRQVDILEKGKQAADLLRTSGYKQDKLVKHVLSSLQQRSDQRKYLSAVSTGQNEIQEIQSKYKENLDDMIKSLKLVVEASESASLPIQFKSKAQEKGVTLKLQQVERSNRARQTGTIPLQPSVTLSLGSLRAKKVVAWVSPDLPRKQYRSVFFTFNARESGDWQVICVHKVGSQSHALFQFEITTSDVQRMQRAGKTAKIKYNDGWVVINAFALLQLLARCVAETG